nr:carbohydrate sulfotransferase 8-like [Cherax quadricarinatus]
MKRKEVKLWRKLRLNTVLIHRAVLVVITTTLIIYAHFLLTHELLSTPPRPQHHNYSSETPSRRTVRGHNVNTTKNMTGNERMLRKVKLVTYKPLHQPRYRLTNDSVLPQVPYCTVASTTWTWHLLRAVGVKDSVISSYHNPHFLLKDRVPPPTPLDHEIGFLNDALIFLVSRHPFHRLVSAYKNKIVEADKRRTHYVDLRRSILKVYQGDTNVTMPTFTDFCHYVADSLEAWLLDPDGYSRPDQHWMPITYICSPCIIDYTVYSKLETMESDTRFIADQCGLGQIINYSMKLNPSTLETDGNSTENMVNQMQKQTVKEFISQKIQDDGKMIKSEDKSPKKEVAISETDENNKLLLQKSYADYLSQLSSEDLQRLYNVYKFDFEIFGYSMDEYK